MDQRYKLRVEQYRRIWKQFPRLAQYSENNIPPMENIEDIVACYVLAPALGGFVEWLIQEAVQSGKRRLYFLARDGYFPYLAAQIFCQKHCLPIECRYLSCSRYSLRLPILHLDRKEALDYICRESMNVTMEKILRRAGLTQGEQQDVQQHLSFSFLPQATLSSSELPIIRRQLSQCQPFLNYMEKHSRAAYSALAGYLRQEGVLEGIPDAIIDSGWTGTTQKILEAMLSRLGRKMRLEGYYWGLYELPPDTVSTNYHTYAFGPGNGLLQKIWFNNCLFEAVYMAPHGTTLSYHLEKRKYLPCYGAITPERRAFVQQMERCLLPYIRWLAEMELLPEITQQSRQLSCELFRQFMGRPTAAEAEVFGNLYFSDDVLEEATPIAPILNQKELNAGHIVPKVWETIKQKQQIVRQSAWYEGSVVRSSSRTKRHLRQYRLYQGARYVWKMANFWRRREI